MTVVAATVVETAAIPTAADSVSLKTLEPVELSGGLRVVAEQVQSVESVSLAVHIATGSRNEANPQMGWSHFLEHLLFRGTPSWSSAELDSEFDCMGGAVDAMTGRESTVLLAKVAKTDAELALEMLCEMVAVPLLTDVEAERGVILEELAMIQDDPSDRLGEAMARAIFGKDPLGNPIAGTVETVSSAGVHELKAFHSDRYVRSSITVAAVGNVDPKWFMERLDAGLGDVQPGIRPEHEIHQLPRSTTFHLEHPSEQVHIQLGGAAPGRDSQERFTMRVLDVLLGGSASSVLFSELREKRGLAYDTGSFVSGALGRSEWGAYIATRPERASEAAEALGSELARFRDRRPSEEAVERAKRHLKGRFLLSRESMSERASSLVAQIGAGMRPLSPAEVVSALDAVTVEAVFSLSNRIFDPELIHAGSIGPAGSHATAALEAAQSGRLTA